METSTFFHCMLSRVGRREEKEYWEKKNNMKMHCLVFGTHFFLDTKKNPKTEIRKPN